MINWKKKKLSLRDLKVADSDKKDASMNNKVSSQLNIREYIPAILVAGILFDYFEAFPHFSGWIRVLWYTVAYIPVGFPVIGEGWESIKRGDFFTEFFLMSIVTLGAFAIGEYPEGVAVMLFYAVGELFQNAAVNRAKGNIKALLRSRDRPDRRENSGSCGRESTARWYATF